MSRPNGPGVPPNGWPADNAPTDGQNPYQDPYYAQRHQQAPQGGQQPSTAGRQPRIQPAPSRTPQAGLPPGGLPGPGQPPAYPQASAQQYAPQQPQGYAPPQYAPPAQPQYAPPAQGYAPTMQPPRPPQGQPMAGQQAQSDPRYGAYAGPDYGAPAAPRQPASQGYAPQYAQPSAPPAQAYVPEQTARPTQAPQGQQRTAPSLESWPTQPQAMPPAQQGYGQPKVDPHGYDLGNYMPSVVPDPRTQRPTAPPIQGQATHAPPTLGQATQGQTPAWSPYGEQQPPQQRTQPPARGLDNPGYPQQAGHDPHAANALEAVADEAEYDEDEEDYEEPPRKTRYGLIAASLLGAIVAGGGLAYGYKMFVGGPTQTAGATPLVKGASAPAKVKPAEPGGTKFANADAKIMDSLAGGQSATAADTSDTGPRAVKTLSIPRETPSVPGMILQGGGPQGPRPVVQQPTTAAPPPPAASPPPAAAAPVAQAPPVQPKKLAVAPPAAAMPAPEAIDAPIAPPKKVAVPKAPPKAALGGPPAATGANGYVAVLASMPASATSKSQAMQQFADLQQKYAGALAGKSPDVVDVKLADKGDYHRLIVGPPGSRDSAGKLCTQLKAVGYTADCWVTPF
jgi:hypothetical protein